MAAGLFTFLSHLQNRYITPNLLQKYGKVSIIRKQFLTFFPSFNLFYYIHKKNSWSQTFNS